jgi:hypothetical protein
MHDQKKERDLLLVILSAGIATAVILLSISTIISAGQKSNAPDVISVTGTYQATAEPDIAKVYVDIITLNDTAQAAKDQNTKVTAAVTSALGKAGVKASQIETESFSLVRKDQTNPVTGQSRFQGYQLTNVLKVTLLNLDNVGPVIDDSVNAGANGIGQVVFDLSEPRKASVMAGAIRNASLDAQQRAAALSSSLGLKLGHVQSVTGSNFVYSPYSFTPAASSGGLVQTAEATAISPGKVTVNAQVGVSYYFS